MHTTAAVRCARAWLLARRMRAAFPGPLGGGEAGTIRPRSGRCQGWQRLFARAGCPLEKPGTGSRTFRPRMDGKRQPGWPSLLVTFLLATQEKSNSGAGRRTKRFCCWRRKEQEPPLPQPLSRKREREAALRGRGRRAHASALGRRTPQRRGGTAHHQFRAEALVAFLQRLAVGRALQVADQPLRRMAGDFLGGLPRGGERGPGLLGERAVLEAGDGEFPRHAEAAGMRGGEYAGGDLVVGAEDRGGAVLQREQFARAAEAVVEGIVAGQDQLAVQRDAVVLQRVLVALVALGAGAVVAATPQEADAGVAELDQVLGDRVGGVA